MISRILHPMAPGNFIASEQEFPANLPKVASTQHIPPAPQLLEK